MFAGVNSVGLFGVVAYPMKIEADISRGMPKFDVVGLPDTAVSESRERVRSALRNTGSNSRSATLRSIWRRPTKRRKVRFTICPS